MKSKKRLITIIGGTVLGMVLVFSIIYVDFYHKCKAWDLGL